MMAADAAAQTPAPTPPESPFAITYIEVDPARADAARGLLARYRDSLKARGPLEFAVLQQEGRAGQFAIVEQWRSAKAREDTAGSPESQAFRASLAPLLVAPIDSRPHYELATGAKAVAPAGLWVVTHVDFVPLKREEGTAELRKLVEASRGTTGNSRFDALIQTGRPNHLTLVEGWTDGAAQEAHSARASTRSFRMAVGPMNGALYDERLYTLLK